MKNECENYKVCVGLGGGKGVIIFDKDSIIMTKKYNKKFNSNMTQKKIIIKSLVVTFDSKIIIKS